MQSQTRTEHSASNSVLIVDDDPTTLRVLEVSLRSEGFAVETASDAAAASRWLARHVPGLVIASATLAGVDGFELCRRLKAAANHASVPVMLMGEPGAANRIRGIEAGAEEFVGRPLFIKDVVGRASLLLRRQDHRRLEADDEAGRDLAGSLAHISVVDLIQALQDHRRSGVLHLGSPQSGAGEIYFRQGAVVDAEVGRLSGREAVFRLLSWTQGTYRIEAKNIRRKDAVGLGSTALVMEGMRRLDEWQRLLRDLPPLATVFEVDYRILAERLAEIPDEVNGLLRLFDGARSLLNVIDDCGVSDAEALGLVRKLYGEGIIRDVQAPAEESAPAAPVVEGWLTEAAGPFRPPPPGATDEPEYQENDQPNDQAGEHPGFDADIHRRPTGPLEPLERVAASPMERSEEPRATREDRAAAEAAIDMRPAGEAATEPPELSRAPEAITVQTPAPFEPGVVAGEPARAVSGEPPVPETAPARGPSAAIPKPRQDEDAVAIASPREPDGGDVRRTLLAAGGIPDLAPMAASGTPTAIVGSLADASAPIRSTEPGMGPTEASPGGAAPRSPGVDAGESGPPRASTDAAALLASVEPGPAPAAAPEALSQSASNWMLPDDHVSTSEALDELNLPSRHRGPLLLIAGATLVAAAFVGSQLWFARHPGSGDARPALVEKAATFPTEAALPREPTPPAPTPRAPAVTPAPPPPAIEATSEKPAPRPAAPPAAELPAAGSGEAAKPAAARSRTVTAVAAEAAARPVPPPRNAPAPATGESARESGFPELLQKCRSAFGQGKMREAAAACAAAKDANGESGDALLMLAHVEFNRNHLKEALQWAEKAIKADPNLADAYVIFGGVQQDAGRNREAKWAYKKYLELAPRGQYAADLRAIIDTL
ncbi:MAG TPA: DUF4388 domain-containing protein [Polyangia bacterium]|nr:DUF4388 domain-containing protein [Polyangia bacterium]